MKIYFFETQEWEEQIFKEQFPDATFVHDALSEENAGQYQDMEAASVFIKSQVSKECIDKLPNVKLITTRSTGFDHVNTGYANEKGIPVCNVPEYGSRTVAEFTFALLLTLSRKMFMGIRQSKECIFDTSALQGFDLYGKTLGIIGLGKIGTEVLHIAKGFGMDLLVYTEHKHPEEAEKLGFTHAELEELLGKSDVISLHLPLTEQTKHILNKDNIMKCKKGSYLINTARGGLIETEALIMALNEDLFEGVGLDVLEEEKEISDELEILLSHDTHSVNFKNLCIDHVLMHHPKVVVTPHNAFNTHEALRRIVMTTIENIRKFTENAAINTV